jgi:tRNA (adenine57-N1/adenine58-N1)-methyltransferase catalytic subunit
MDFGRPLVVADSVCSKSGVRLLDAESADNELDRRALEAANQSVIDLFGNGVDASLVVEHVLPRQDAIRQGDLVVLQESFDKLDFCYTQPGLVYSNRNGHFHHADFLRKPFASQLRSRDGLGYCYLLKPTPELWTRSLNHRTQIIHELDQAQIVFQLDLRPNMVVAESGTGSGALSHALIRTIAPHGHLYTYEFNKMRSETARNEFRQHGLSHLVTVQHTDVCNQGFVGLEPHRTDAVVLDLPEPWLAIEHAQKVLKPTARIASYSPCVEQVQRTCQALRQYGFHSIQTFEYRLQEHYVDEVEYGGPPRDKRPRIDPLARLAAKEAAKQSGVQTSSVGEEVVKKNGDGSGGEKSASTTGVAAAAATAATNDNTDKEAQEETETPASNKRKKHLVARPFSTMRGHTAFITFATAGNHSLRPVQDEGSELQTKEG